MKGSHDMPNFLRRLWQKFRREPAEDRRPKDEASRDLARINKALIWSLVIGLLIISARHARGQVTLNVFAIACMWAASCLISGAAVGFLFGIPRVVQGRAEEKSAPAEVTPKTEGSIASPASASNTQDAGGYRQEVNSNLVEISDWLTKIIVGLGLVNLKSVPGLLDRTASTLARGLSNSTACGSGTAPCDNYAFATALIVGFTLLGFLMGYLYTRLFLAGAFSRADQSGSTLLASSARVIQQEKSDSAKSDSPRGDAGEVAEWQVRAAERISELPEAQDVSSTVAALQKLGRDYDLLRMNLLSSDTRTRRMTDIVVNMRGLALAARPQIAHFADSASPGNRLVAVAMLQMQPDPAYFQWLLDRITLEKPFIAFHAILALTRAAEKRDPAQLTLLRKLFTDWLKTEKARDMLGADTDRSRLLKKVLAQLDISV
jgi:hypothetical protein